MKGVRIEKASLRLKRGTSMWLTLSVGDDLLPARIPATVTRETETGFAVDFPELPHSLKVLLDGVLSKVAELQEDDEDPTEPVLSPPVTD
jgi:hypothetical protein